MKHLLLALSLFTASANIFAQQQQPHDVAYAFMRTGDFDNAILVLNKAIQQGQNSQQLQQDLAMAYFFKKDYSKAKEQVLLLLNRDDADVISYQIAGNVYKALEEVKEADKLYKKAVKKFPASGPLFSEYGEFLWAKDDPNAIKLWERGIEVDPAYAGNYYNAASYYFEKGDKVWSLIYGEIFVNMEYLTDRATEIKKMLLNVYKEKVFASPLINDIA
ncbi:MAG TPA: tetratricopeptide repeat protein, partial [Flavisolibacter sp.]|nr:tetratricopeptide repeat protein [Flavisolibacter sp.]